MSELKGGGERGTTLKYVLTSQVCFVGLYFLFRALNGLTRVWLARGVRGCPVLPGQAYRCGLDVGAIRVHPRMTTFTRPITIIMRTIARGCIIVRFFFVVCKGRVLRLVVVVCVWHLGSVFF